MKVEHEIALPNITDEQVADMNGDILSPRDLRRRLENLSLSADAKSLLDELTGLVVRIGGRVVQLGRAVLTLALDLLRISPGAIFGAILGAVIAMFIASVPIFGAILGALLSPLLIAFGIAAGGIPDLMSGRIGERALEFIDRYRPLVAV